MKKLQITTSTPKDFEDILEHLGGFGKFQLLILVIILSFEIPTAFLIYIPIFIGHVPEEWFCDGEVVDSVSACACNGTLAAPLTSFVAEWELICDYAWVPDCATSVQMAGMLFGNLIAAQASDWYGRRYTFLGTIVTMTVGSSASALAPNPYVYFVGRFLCGAGFSSHLNVGAVYSVEFLPTKWRSLSGSVSPYGEATMLLALLAYLIPSWRTLLWITTLPFAITIFVLPFVPQSPRWLLQKGRTAELHEVLEKIAKVNQRPPIPLDVLQKIVDRECPVATDNNARFTYLDFLKPKNKKIGMKAGCVMSIFFAWSVLFWGLSFNIKNMGGNLYWNVFYLGAIDSVGFPSALLILERFGRRMSVLMSISMGSLFMVLLAIFHLTLDPTLFSTLFLVTAFIGKFGVSVARSAARALISESFPTSIRSMATGLCGACSSIGGVFSGQLAYLGTKNPSYPFFAFAVISVAGSLFTLFMKETRGKPLQESVGRKRSRAVSIISNLILGISPSKDEAHL